MDVDSSPPHHAMVMQPVRMHPTGQDTRAFYAKPGPQPQADSDIKKENGPVESVEALHSAMLYQNLKGGGSLPVGQQPYIQPRMTPTFSPGFAPQVVRRSVFVMDSKKTDNQDIMELLPSPPMLPYGSIGNTMSPNFGSQLLTPSPTQYFEVPAIAGPQVLGHKSEIWSGDEKSILKDIEKDSVMTDNQPPANNRSGKEEEDHDVELTLRVTQESNLFNPDIVHTKVTYPPRKSAEERARVLITRAFDTKLSPNMSQMSADFANHLRTSTGSSAEGFGRLSPAMYLQDQFQLSMSPLSFEGRDTMNLNIPQMGQNQMHLNKRNSLSPNQMYRNNMSPIKNENQKQYPMHMPPPMGMNPMSMNFLQPMQMYGGMHHPGGLGGGDSISNMKFNNEKVTHRACVRCHKVKKKCIRTGLGPCKSCAKKGVVCENRKDGRSNNRGGRKKTPLQKPVRV